ncbi:hypothetical protein M8J73_44370, partial [Streptomyces neyagawaensis]|nr:hypothetical protein [Streptomyces neyagawaensis]
LGGGPSGGGLLGGAPQRGQVGAGQGPRAALPGNPSGPGNPGGQRGPQGGPPMPPQGGRPAPAGAGAGAFGGGQAPGAPQGLQAAGPGGPDTRNFENFNDSGRQGGFAGGGSGLRPGGSFGDGGAPRQGGAGDSGPGAVPPKQGKERSGRRRPQLPGRGGPRAELPGGNAPRTPSWSDENAQPPAPRASLDAPRGHDEQPDVTAPMPRVDPNQGPASTSQFPRPDYGAPATGQNGSGSFVRPDVFGGAGAPPAPGGPSRGGAEDPSSTGRFATAGYDGSGTGQFPVPGRPNPQNNGQYGAPDRASGQDTGQFGVLGRQNGQGPGQYDPSGRQNPQDTGQFERPQVNGENFGGPRQPQRPPMPQQRPARQEPEALPPAPGPGDGRTPLYDTLETNWFHGQGGQSGQNVQGGQQPQRQPGNGVAPQRPVQAPEPPAAPQRSAAPAAPASAAWRSTPNDDLVRQAERVRQPSAGGVTTSGLPRRVPRANLVPGTAQQQQHQSGPQVSRAPDDVRGRLTNLRRGIAQGRQVGNGQTGSFPNPTHQQER